ncbi:MAG: hypothetical protein ABJA79_08930 [Parafilimonas sp.]
MQIQIKPHTLVRAKERGASEEEIKQTLEDGISILANQTDLQKVKSFL